MVLVARPREMRFEMRPDQGQQQLATNSGSEGQHQIETASRHGVPARAATDVVSKRGPALRGALQLTTSPLLLLCAVRARRRVA